MKAPLSQISFLFVVTLLVGCGSQKAPPGSLLQPARPDGPFPDGPPALRESAIYNGKHDFLMLVMNFLDAEEGGTDWTAEKLDQQKQLECNVKACQVTDQSVAKSTKL